MTVFHLHPPVGHGGELHAVAEMPSALRRKTSRRQGTTVVEGVVLTNTGAGWRAQGIHLCRVEDSPAYWIAEYDGEAELDVATSLKRLVRKLLRVGELVADAHHPSGGAA